MKFGILPAAELDAALAAAWYDDQRAGLGDEFLTAFSDAYNLISSTPQALPTAEGYLGRQNVRRYRLKRFPYVVSFLCRQDEVLVVAVSHTRRHPSYWLERLN